MDAKQIAADRAASLVKDGMVVGLGSGSTAALAIEAIGRRVKQGLSIQAAASSESSDRLARKVGIPMIDLAKLERIDLTIDGADEVDPSLTLIKGGGGALLREKMLAANSRAFVVIVDESKLVKRLGTFPLPVEIVPFACGLTRNRLRALGCEPALRSAESGPFRTDNGNFIADCSFGAIPDAALLAERIVAIPGVVEHGLFVGMTHSVIVGRQDGSVSLLTGGEQG